ncbi:MAG: hypothetical protein LBT29_00550 [Flavobacteriaceae bacterium]|jgi:hypothetical protein|nr:hypothetical protein [Flavobacteriaceae bacterium]
MGRLIEIIFFCVVAFFVFRFLSRLLDSSPSSGQAGNKPKPQAKKTKVKWDAETVDYEEIEKNKNEKK